MAGLLPIGNLKQTELNSALWNAADVMRQTMTADVYKDYLLGLVFFKSLSDRILHEVVDLMENRKPETLEEAQKIFEEAVNSPDGEDLKEELIEKFGCYIPPTSTFTHFANEVESHNFMLSNLKQVFRDIEQSHKNYIGLFEEFDVDSKNLGNTDSERNKMISSIIRSLSEIDFSHYSTDALGDAYEYLISMFAAESGQKAGEFYTPTMVSRLIGKIVTMGNEEKAGFSIYDPTMGSGSLLLQPRNFINNSDERKLGDKILYFGQEIKNQTYNLARMNMMLHRVPASQHTLHLGDSLGPDWPSDEPTSFDAVVMNPPYSQKYSAVPGLLTDPRFAAYGKLPPSSKADLAFLLHGFYHLKDSGTMAIVMPHGVLFRGGAEGVIRQRLLENGSIYAVIGLPPNIFFNTGIPTCIVVLRKNHKNRDVLFIDASKGFRKGKARNYLEEENLKTIIDAFTKRENIEKYAHLASFEEIKENEYNLNIPRYVDSTEEKEVMSLEEIFAGLQEVDSEEKKLADELNLDLRKLGLSFKI